jgi:hypothetical protein
MICDVFIRVSKQGVCRHTIESITLLVTTHPLPKIIIVKKPIEQSHLRFADTEMECTWIEFLESNKTKHSYWIWYLCKDHGANDPKILDSRLNLLFFDTHRWRSLWLPRFEAYDMPMIDVLLKTLAYLWQLFPVWHFRRSCRHLSWMTMFHLSRHHRSFFDALRWKLAYSLS